MRIDTTALLRDLRPVLADLRNDLLERAKLPGVRAGLRTAYSAEKSAQRTADPFDVWQRHRATQVAAAWVLSVIFVRTLEDRDLLDRRRIAGPGAEDSEQQFFTLAPFLSVRDYLLTVFRELAQLPGAAALFDGRHNPVWVLGPSAKAARRLVAFFRKQDADGALLYDFSNDTSTTRFLGDIYQDLDEDVRKKYALLQTPDFVESFILDDTLDPAIRTFGLDKVRLIDPTCGSGHFLLGAFARLQAAWREAEPATDPQILAQRAIDQVYGADLNPYAVAIARFRLTVAFLDASGIRRLAAAPPLRLNLCVADSLLHGVSGQTGHLDSLLSEEDYEDDSARQFWGADLFALEDKAEALRILSQRYHAVVGNPPYITEKDPARRDKYRSLYDSAAGKYALSAPFTERFFQLGVKGGYIGMINANSFMKREFGKKLIQEVLPKFDLTSVIDTSGAYIPGHGTPTVLLFGKNEAPSDSPIRAVMGKRGEPTTPEDPSNGEVWSAIRDHHNDLGFENDYLSIAELERERLHRHPWTLTGGGAAELKSLIESRSTNQLSDVVDSIGITSFTLEDDAFIQDKATLGRFGVEQNYRRPMVTGEVIRDWCIGEAPIAIFPYNEDLTITEEESSEAVRFLWPYRTNLANNKLFGGKTKIEGGLKWYEYGRLTTNKLRTPLSIAFAFVATHNHFVLDRGGKVFNRTAPIIKLPEDATEEDHLALVGYLNSSTACFWMKQVMANRGYGAGSANARITKSPFEDFYEFAGGLMKQTPIVRSARITELTSMIDGVAASMASVEDIIDAAIDEKRFEIAVDALLKVEHAKRRRLIYLQEELDWLVYEALGLIDDEILCSKELNPLAEIEASLRPFEVLLAQNYDESYTARSWFEVHKRTPYPRYEDAKIAPGLGKLYSQRSQAIQTSKALRIIETPEYKRRWTLRDYGAELQEAGVELLMKAAEGHLSGEIALRRGDDLAQAVLSDAKLVQVAEVLFPESGDPTRDVETCLRQAAVAYVAQLRFRESGLEKRREWKRVWELQRREDRGETLEENIPVPPKFGTKDFGDTYTWRLRGKLNVPKERFISYPGAESDDDPSLLIGWAGWNHLERAQALAALYQRRKTEDGWEFERLTPLLAGLGELVPWLKQWYNEPSAEYGGARMGEFFEDFVSQQVREAGKTVEDLEAWRPPKKARGGRRKTGRSAGTSKQRGGSGCKPNVTPQQLLDAVRAISDGDGGDGASQVEVAERLGVSAQMVARVAKGLLEDGSLELLSKRPKRFGLDEPRSQEES